MDNNAIFSPRCHTDIRRHLIYFVGIFSVLFGGCNLHFDLDSVSHHVNASEDEFSPEDAISDADISPKDADSPDAEHDISDISDIAGDGTEVSADADTSECLPGWFDLDQDGDCEYQCEPTNAGQEICDGVDNNCDGQVDEGNPGGGVLCENGAPGICAGGTTQCVDAKIECVANQSPAPEEDCGSDGLGNGLDDDCNGTIDDGCDECISGADRPCYSGPQGTLGVGVCVGGRQLCVDGHWGDCTDEVTPSPEICNGIDDTCDGSVDVGNQLCPAANQRCQEGVCCNDTASGRTRCNGALCKTSSECVSGYCHRPHTFMPTGVCSPVHCGDGETNEDETRKDCGGSCLKCSGEYCSDHTDCASGACYPVDTCI